MIAFIWQNDWDAVACLFAGRLVAEGHEVCAYVKNGQAGGAGGTTGATRADAGAGGVGGKGGASGTGGTSGTGGVGGADVTSGAGYASGAGGKITKAVLSAEVKRVKSLAAAVESATIVFTLLSTPQEVEDVYLGEGGILEVATDGSLLIDLSTSSPKLVKELYALAAVHDHSFVEAPFEGAVEPHTIRIFAAGEPDNLAKALPLLHTLTPDVCNVGLPGSAMTVKLASQIALACALMGVVEALTFAMIAGIETATALEVIKRGAAASAVAEAFGQRILDEDFAYGGDLNLFFNELTCALDTADEMGLALPGLETAQQLYDLLVLVGGGRKGIHALALIYCDEERCSKHGLNWELAQRAMDVYERAGDGAYDDYDFDYDYDYDDDDDECDDPNCTHHHHRFSDDNEDDAPPSMSRFFSSN